MKIQLISDIHGEFDAYFNIIDKIDDDIDYSIQLGDFGLGFNKKFDLKYINKIKKYPLKHFIIRGNHDSSDVFKQQKTYLGDFGLFKNKLFFISGAWSIDYYIRTPFINWWPDEELSTKQFNDVIDLYTKIKPEYVISHDCPEIIKNSLIDSVHSTLTGKMMNILLEIHQPKIWIFGHYHIDKKINYKNTIFICLNSKQSYIFDI